jgi:site-specific DNA recombinase
MGRLRGAKYKRISEDREGRELGVSRQDEDLDALAARLDIEVVADYTDNDISASTRSNKKRPRYDAMIADARSRSFDVILAYTSGRLTRRPREHEDQIELAERYGIKYAYVASPSFDLNTAAGRRVARILAANDAGEAEDIGERVARAAAQRAANGKFHGGVIPFGFKRTAKGIVPNPPQVKLIKEATTRLLNGETLLGIAIDWNKVHTETFWYPRTIKRYVTNPAVVGERTHRGTTYSAPWPAIVSRDDWTRLRAILLDPARNVAGTGRRKYELSGLLVCGRCGKTLTVTRPGKDQGYECAKLKGKAGCGSIKILKSELEQYVEEMLFASVDDLPAPPDTNDPSAELIAAIDADTTALQRLEDEYDDGSLPRDRYARRRDRITARLDTNRRALANATRTTPRHNLPSGDELRTVWPDKDNIWRRTVIASVIDRIVIHPHPAGVQTTPSRRRTESPEEHRARYNLHRARLIAQRTEVIWKV